MPFTDVPPSYESTISREAWTLIAPYISSADLCACCLVSRKWNTIFIPFLWGDPASHFGIANDAVYVALTRFKKTLRKARLDVRALTHTLHLPPALSEIYGGPHATWLRDVLEYLPELQSLIVSRLPFFDHHALVALRSSGLAAARRASEDAGADQLRELPKFGLKLLLAGSEPNTTSIGLTIALPRFPNLVYLDLSFTKSARSPNVLASLAGLYDLQALKLQGVGMRDGEAEILARSIGIRVRLLDLRDNHLTDMSVRALLQACFLSMSKDQNAARLNTRRVEDWPIGMAPGPDFFSLDTLRSEDLDHELLKQLTSPLTGRLAFEDIPHRGLTHLYIANNQLSVEGLSSLLKSQRLHILDAGSVESVKTIERTKSLSAGTSYTDRVRLPGPEKLVPILAQSASKNLTYLRIDHAVMTGSFEASAQQEKKVTAPSSSAAELPGVAPHSAAVELAGTERYATELPAAAHYAVEMPANREPIFELDATPAQPRVELPGDMIYFAVSPPIGTRPEDNQAIPEPERHEPIRGEGPYAPEVVVNGAGKPSEHQENGTHVSPTGHDVSDEGSTNSTVRSVRSPISPMTPHGTHFQPLVAPASASATTTAAPSKPVMQEPAKRPPSPSRPLTPNPQSIRQSRIQYLLSLRPDLAKQTSLYPTHLPNLRTLILTNVPAMVPESSLLITRLKAFITHCALESHLSNMLAATDYSLPPGRARHLAEKAAAKRIFALTTLVLEMANPSVAQNQSSRAWEHSRQRQVMSKSSTGDMDSEALWSAAADDFSFFAEGGGEEEDECGIYDHEREKYFPRAAAWDDKVLLTPDDYRPDSSTNGDHYRRDSPASPHLAGGTLSPVHALSRPSAGSLSGGGGTIWRSPRELPMGRNRRLSNEVSGRSSTRSSFDSPRPDFTPELPTGGHNIPAPSLPSPPTTRRPPTSQPISPPPPPAEEETQVDVIASLSAFRRARKAAFENEMRVFKTFRLGHRRAASQQQQQQQVLVQDGVRSGEQEQEQEEILLPPFVEGHWAGEIKVVRNPTPKGRTGTVDMYGNYFEKGYLYP
jgi:hypothetical protein